MRKKILFIFIILSSVFACRHIIPVNPKPVISGIDSKIPLKVGILIDSSLANNVSTQRNICILGFFPSFEIPIGEALSKASERAFKQLFDEVILVSSKEEAEKTEIDLIIVPTLKNFNIGQATLTSFNLNLEIFDHFGKSFYENDFESDTWITKPICLSIVGPVLPKYAITASVNLSFENVFIKAIKQLKTNVNWDKISSRISKSKEMPLSPVKEEPVIPFIGNFNEETSSLTKTTKETKIIEKKDEKTITWKITVDSVRRGEKNKLMVAAKFENLTEKIQDIRFSSETVLIIDELGKKISGARMDSFGLVTSSINSAYPGESFIKEFLFEIPLTNKVFKLLINEFPPFELTDKLN